MLCFFLFFCKSDSVINIVFLQIFVAILVQSAEITLSICVSDLLIIFCVVWNVIFFKCIN